MRVVLVRNRLVPRFVRLAIVTAFAAAAALSFGKSVAANDDDDRPCSNRTLRGDYGVLFSGTLLGEPTVGTALRTYDGKGHFVQIDNEHSFFGSVTERQAQGTYAVKPNCTGTMTLVLPDATIESTFVIVGNGEEVNEAVMAPAPAFVTGVQTRVR
jgi:hypothetical protein